jgi:DNA modification methylase
MNINKIKPYDKNAKKHPDKQIRQIANSIKEFGFNQPIVLDNKGVIIVGHGRYEAAKQMGLEEVPTIEVDLTEEQAKAYRLADNKLNESDWEMDKVIDELKGMSDEMVDLTGFDRDLLIEPDDKDDEVPEVPEEPKSKLGDLYELGNHRVLCGDSTKKEDVEMLMDGNKADMVFTDPPYSVNYEKKNKEVLKSKEYSKIEGDDMKVEDIARDLWKPVFDNLAEVSKDGASIYVTMPQGGDQMMMMMMMDSWQVKHELIWVKNSPVFSMGRLDYDYMHEPIIYGWKKNHQFYGGGQFKKSVWNIQRDGNKSHPTMKPVELIVNMLANSSKEEDITIDFFLGSGSTLIASEKTGRICYGMELDPKYADTIVERWCRYTGITNIKKNGVDYKWELQEDK